MQSHIQPSSLVYIQKRVAIFGKTRPDDLSGDEKSRTSDEDADLLILTGSKYLHQHVINKSSNYNNKYNKLIACIWYAQSQIVYMTLVVES